MRLATKRGADATRWFPAVVQGLAQLKGGPHVMDGEVCVLDELGRSDYKRLQDRARRRCFYPDCDPVVFCAFDLLALQRRLLAASNAIGHPATEAPIPGISSSPKSLHQSLNY